MSDCRGRELESADTHRVGRRFERALQVEEVERPPRGATFFQRLARDDERDRLDLAGARVARAARGEDVSRLEESHVARAVVEVVADGFEQARQKRRAHEARALDDRVREADERALAPDFLKARHEIEAALALAVCRARLVNEAVVDRLVEAGRREHLTGRAPAPVAREVFARDGRGRQRLAYFLVTDEARDLLDQVLLDRDVRAPGRGTEEELRA